MEGLRHEGVLRLYGWRREGGVWPSYYLEPP